MELDKRLERIERLFIISFKKALNVADVALLLGVSESRVRHMTNEGILPYSKPNGKLYFNKDDIERYLLADRQPSKAEIESMAATRIAASRIK
jgi:hypothetical protein